MAQKRHTSRGSAGSRSPSTSPKVTAAAAATVAAEPPKRSTMEKMFVRSFFAVLMMAGLAAVYWLGHKWLCGFVVAVQVGAYYELTKVQHAFNKERNDKGGLRLFRTMRFAWLALALYYSYGMSWLIAPFDTGDVLLGALTRWVGAERAWLLLLRPHRQPACHLRTAIQLFPTRLVAPSHSLTHSLARSITDSPTHSHSLPLSQTPVLHSLPVARASTTKRLSRSARASPSLCVVSCRVGWSRLLTLRVVCSLACASPHSRTRSRIRSRSH
jgi:hypothetical protein